MDFVICTRRAAPTTSGEAMLVPLIVVYEPPLYVERILTPGAAMSTSGPKLLQVARVSSVEDASPPHFPSESAMAETVITSGKLAGTE